MADIYYKWTADCKPIYGKGEYVLDGGWQPRHDGPLVECQKGYHVCREQDLPRWCGTELWEIEPDLADAVACDDKMIVRTWRAIRKLPWACSDAVAYACWCAELARRYAGSGSSAAARGALDAHNAAQTTTWHAALVERAAHLGHKGGVRASEVIHHAREVTYHTRCAAHVTLVAAGTATEVVARQQLAWIMNRLAENQTRETNT